MGQPADSRELIRLRSAQIAPNKDAAHPFDIEHGTDTGGYLSPKEIVTGHAHDAQQYGYSAIAPSVFREMLRRWLGGVSKETSGAKAPEATSSDVAAEAATHKADGATHNAGGATDKADDATHKADRSARTTHPRLQTTYAHADTRRCGEFTFVDVGAGKGRALLLASELPFRKVIGVELSAELAQTAQGNAERWSRAHPHGGPAPIRVLHLDALEFCWPRTSLLVFMYNPFDCELVEQLLERLEKAALRGHASKGRDRNARPSSAIDLLYANPTCADVVSKRGRWVLLWTDRIDMDAADQAADPYGTTFDRISCYRLRI